MTDPSEPSSGAAELAVRLLDAHVAHEVRQLRGERFAQLVSREVEHALADASRLTLDRVMDRASVKAVAGKYVETFRLPAAIPEIAGEIATRLRSHPANDVPLGELVGRPAVEEVVAVLAEMRSVRVQILRGLATSATLQAGMGGLVHGLAAGAVGSGRRLAKRVPLVSTGVTVAEKVAGGALAGVDQRSRELAEQAARLLLGYLGDNMASSVSDDELRTAVLEVWDALATRPVREFLDLISDEDLIDLFVAAFQVWLDLRGSGYVTALVDSGVDFFFDTYGSTTLDRLLEEFGLGRDDLVEEALRFGPPVIEALAETGLLDALVRRHLEAFYLSPEAQELLAR